MAAELLAGAEEAADEAADEAELETAAVEDAAAEELVAPPAAEEELEPEPESERPLKAATPEARADKIWPESSAAVPWRAVGTRAVTSLEKASEADWTAVSCCSVVPPRPAETMIDFLAIRSLTDWETEEARLPMGVAMLRASLWVRGWVDLASEMPLLMASRTAWLAARTAFLDEGPVMALMAVSRLLVAVWMAATSETRAAASR